LNQKTPPLLGESSLSEWTGDYPAKIAVSADPFTQSIDVVAVLWLRPANKISFSASVLITNPNGFDQFVQEDEGRPKLICGLLMQ
jgi:hypothetical protein